MKFYDKLKRRIGKRFFGIPVGDQSFVDNLGVEGETNQKETLAEYGGVTYRAVNSIAEEVASTPNFAFKTLPDGSKQRVDNNKFLAVLENPNPEMTKYDLIEAHQSFIEMVGEVFWYFARGETTKEIKEIYILRPDRVKVVIDKQGSVVGYKLKRNSGSDLNLHPDEIYHHKTFNPNNAYRGIGTLQAALTYSKTERLSARFSFNFLKNNATPAGVLSLDGDVDKPAFDKFKRQWREGISGTENAGKIAVVRGMSVDFKKVGLSLADIDLKSLREFTINDILMMFRVPKPLIGLADATGLGRGNVESLEYIYMKRNINPKLNRLDEAYNRIIKKHFPNEQSKIGHDNVVPEDKEFELTRFEKGVDKWITRDEARKEDNLEAVGANQLFAPINVIPIDLDNTKSTKSYKILLPKKAESKVDKNQEEWDVSDKSDESPQEIFRKITIDRIAESFISVTQKRVNKFLRDQEKKVLATVNPKKKLDVKGIQDGLNLAEETKILSDSLFPVMVELAMEAGQEAIQFAGAAEDVKFLLNDNVTILLNEHLEKMSKNFNNKTIDALGKTLSDGMLAGEGNAKLGKRVQAVYKEAEAFRSLRVARTETHWTAVNATEQAYFQSGLVVKKKWFANPGACGYCATMDGTEVPIGQAFIPLGGQIEDDNGELKPLQEDYEPIENAHAHPNCRCTLLPVVESSKSIKEEGGDKLIPKLVDEACKEIDKRVEASRKAYEKDMDKKFEDKTLKVNSAVNRINNALKDEEQQEENTKS